MVITFIANDNGKEVKPTRDSKSPNGNLEQPDALENNNRNADKNHEVDKRRNLSHLQVELIKLLL